MLALEFLIGEELFLERWHLGDQSQSTSWPLRRGLIQHLRQNSYFCVGICSAAHKWFIAREEKLSHWPSSLRFWYSASTYITNKWWINQEEEFSLNVLEKKCARTLLGFVAKGGDIKITGLVGSPHCFCIVAWSIWLNLYHRGMKYILAWL